jgi:pilus assembly protein Flp/PilA
MIRKFLKDESGVTMIEYGLIAALIGVVCIVVLTQIGGDLNSLFGTVSTELQKATP